MASHHGSGASLCVQIQAIQTVVSTKPTEPTLTRRVVLTSVTGVVFQQCHQIVLYYKKANTEDSAWVMIGRLKESLGRALVNYPMFAGRLKWDDNGGEERRELVLVSNDSGLRLVEAKYPVSMDEFLGMKGREEAASELVYWEDLKEHDPQFCPLYYIQVTEFECGGYSIGLSLSVLLGDSTVLTGFLKHLATTHLDIFFKNKPPAFYLPKHKAIKLYSIPNNLSRRKHSGQTLVYHINNAQQPQLDLLKRLASLCIKDAVQKLDASLDLEFILFVKNDETNELTVDKGSVLTWPSSGDAHPKLNGVNLDDDSILSEVTFWEGHKPIHGAYWIGLNDKEGVVMVNMSEHDNKAIDITVSIP
ncbi:unnamed protein product [Rhodiola kirilowii]